LSKRILIIGPAWVGDMVMAQSLFKELKQQDNSIILDVVAPNWSRALLERMPEVRHAHPMPVGHGALQLRQRYRIAQTLKSYQYDQAVVLPNSWKSALIPWLTNIPKRTGYLGECRWGLLNDPRILNKKRYPLMVDRFVALATEKSEKLNTMTASHPRLVVQPALRQEALEKFSLATHPKHPILVLCPGAEFGASKRWPEQYYAKVALAKQKEGWSVWLMGSQNDKIVAAHIQAETNGKCVDLTGKTTLGEAIDLLSLATMVVTNDSGLMHIAAALERPLVAVYGSTDPGFTPPLGMTSKIVRLSMQCSPCFKRECPLKHHACLQQLKPERVLTAMKAVESK
jgi:heptosyltransferase-2